MASAGAIDAISGLGTNGTALTGRLERMRAIDADALCEYANNQRDKTIDANDIMRFPAIELTNDLPPARDSYHDLVMRIVRAGLCARKPQHISVYPDGNVTVFGMTETARLVKEKDRVNHWHCSKCGTVFGDSARTYRFCPECGAEFTVDVLEDD